jgi:GNAT superfamily N-acetyltransferase
MLISPEISRVTADHREDSVQLLVRAFFDDPIFAHFFPSDERRTRALRICLDDSVRSSLRHGATWAARRGREMVGVAVWMPPGEQPATLADKLRWRVSRWRIRAISPSAERGLWEGFAATGALHPATPHWYLQFVGVDVRSRGRDLGERLLRPVHDIADETSTLCYLETPSPRNHDFYRRLGYEDRAEASPFPGAPPLHTMSRVPRPKASG